MLRLITFNWTAELLCVLLHTCLKPSLVFTESPLAAFLPTVRSWGWVRERGRERLVLVPPLWAAAWRACMSYLLFCCFESECTLITGIYLSSTPSADNAGMTGHNFFLHRSKHFHRNYFALGQNLYVLHAFVLYSIVIVVGIKKDKIPRVCNSLAEQACPIC